MATHSSILAWRIPWTEEPAGLQSMGSQRVRHNGVNNAATTAGSRRVWAISPHVSLSVVSNSLRPHGLWSARLLCAWNSPGKNTGVGCHSLLQRIFPTQGLNLGLLHCRQILYHLSHQGIFHSLLPNPGMEARSPALQVVFLQAEPPGSHNKGEWFQL